ncbi:hypothetical protein [Lichenifustis flavocetrariae]|uniref:Uncharacterized protein n=1 Tax=Lichenifustis flavocetrariae TaxID=2949735 RepID=A0AA41Z0I4_9HYPH|nr:hypothetical protein [Lichenifustis flavocetrariae]MCW6507077.1 hypothetical protein [Lichenifustis flavocetrariae]
MSHRFIPYDLPMFTSIAVFLAGECEGTLMRDWVMRVYPDVLVERARAMVGVESFQQVLPPLVAAKLPWGKFSPKMSWDELAIAKAIRVRDAAAEGSFTMPMLAKGNVGDWSDFHRRLREYLISTNDCYLVDWLNGLYMSDPPLCTRLHRMTWAQAEERSRKWHAAMAKRKAVAAGSDGTADRVESHDGHHWVCLVSEDALDRESDAMGHCVGRGGYDRHAKLPVERGGIWSLRDAKGRSVLTAFFAPDVRPRLHNDVQGYTHMVLPDPSASKENHTIQVVGARNRPMEPDELRHMAPLRAAYRARGVTMLPEMFETPKRGSAPVSMHDGHVVTTSWIDTWWDETGRKSERKVERHGPELVATYGPPEDRVRANGSVNLRFGFDTNIWSPEGQVYLWRDERWRPLTVKTRTEIRVAGRTLVVVPAGSGRVTVESGVDPMSVMEDAMLIHVGNGRWNRREKRSLSETPEPTVITPYDEAEQKAAGMNRQERRAFKAGRMGREDVRDFQRAVYQALSARHARMAR